MPHISELSSIIRPEDDVAPERDAKLVHIRNGKVVTPTFGLTLPGTKAFVVRPGRASPWLDPRGVIIVDPNNLERDSLDYSIEVTIPAKGYEEVVAALTVADDPATVIHDKIKDVIDAWIKQHCMAHPGLTLRERVRSNVPVLQEQVAAELTRTLGIGVLFLITGAESVAPTSISLSQPFR